MYRCIYLDRFQRKPNKAATKLTPDAAWDDEDDQDITYEWYY